MYTYLRSHWSNVHAIYALIGPIYKCLRAHWPVCNTTRAVIGQCTRVYALTLVNVVVAFVLIGCARC